MTGGRVCFSETARGWGREDLVAIDVMESPASGFWLGDSFVIRTDIRIITPENESQMISVDGNTLTCTVSPVPYTTDQLTGVVSPVASRKSDGEESFQTGVQRICIARHEMVSTVLERR